MDELLKPVSTTYRESNTPADPPWTLLVSQQRSSDAPKVLHKPSADNGASSPADTLQLLKSQPTYDELVQALQTLTDPAVSAPALASGVKNAAVIQTLVSDIVPNYWQLLVAEEHSAEGTEHLELLVTCLRSVTALHALSNTIASLTRTMASPDKGDASGLTLAYLYLDVLNRVLQGNDTIRKIWSRSLGSLESSTSHKEQSTALLSYLTRGRVVAQAAELCAQLEKEASQPGSTRMFWVADGAAFCEWMGQNIAFWTRSDPEQSGAARKFRSEMYDRALSLGYNDRLVQPILEQLLFTKEYNIAMLCDTCFTHTRAREYTLDRLLIVLARRWLNQPRDESETQSMVSAVAGLLQAILASHDKIKHLLYNWSIATEGAGLGDSTGVRRAVIAVLSQDKDLLHRIFEKSMMQFGDELFLKHTPILRQETQVEILLLSAGYLKRAAPLKFKAVLRSSGYMKAISNRLGSDSTRVRVLGLVVGESLSALSDTGGSQLDFHMEETKSDDCVRLKALPLIEDKVGSFDNLVRDTRSDNTSRPERPRPAQTVRSPHAKPVPNTKPVQAPKKVRPIIEEISDNDDDEEDEELVPYRKGHDPEDSDDDATLVQRVKLKPPVYVRDLLTFLRDTENYEKQKLALETAPVLIRRKATYGTEVQSHAIELAERLSGIQDTYEMEDFSDLKAQGMIALITAQPATMAPWFARSFFEGDYSLTQRSALLIALGLSARETAGLDTSRYQDQAAFPSSKLPAKVEGLYLDADSSSRTLSSSTLKALPATSLDSISRSITATFLGPMAAEAADATTGPDMLKLQTVKDNYKHKKSVKAAPVRRFLNKSAAVLAESFFSPLTAHFQVALRHSSRILLINPTLLSLYLQTLGIVLHAAGPSTLSLPQMTSELWTLLLGVRTHVQGDTVSLRGWLIAMAALLEVNEDDGLQKLCRTQGREVVETREWVRGVFERTRGDDGGEENEVKMLAAGTLIKLGEAIEQHTNLMMKGLMG